MIDEVTAGAKVKLREKISDSVPVGSIATVLYISDRIKTKHPKVFKKEKIWYNVKVPRTHQEEKHGNTETVHTGI